MDEENWVGDEGWPYDDDPDEPVTIADLGRYRRGREVMSGWWALLGLALLGVSAAAWVWVVIKLVRWL